MSLFCFLVPFQVVFGQFVCPFLVRLGCHIYPCSCQDASLLASVHVPSYKDGLRLNWTSYFYKNNMYVRIKKLSLVFMIFSLYTNIYFPLWQVTAASSMKGFILTP
jgi:hypothetical protein